MNTTGTNDPLAQVADLRGCLADGYTPQDIDRVFRRLEQAYGIYLLCFWALRNDDGYSGESHLYAYMYGGRLFELSDSLRGWLTAAAADTAHATPGAGCTWYGQEVAVPDNPRQTSHYNFALTITASDMTPPH
ncbi:hypothetical protein ACWF9B_00540 [Streptomyces sp. NPDC055089]